MSRRPVPQRRQILACTVFLLALDQPGKPRLMIGSNQHFRSGAKTEMYPGTRIREIEVHGAPRARGIQYGQAAADLIRRLYKTRMGIASASSSEPAVLRNAQNYRVYVEKYVPEVMDEIAGIADGAGITFEEAFFLQVATELERTAEGCSCVGSAHSAHGPIVAQNWDVPAGRCETQVVLRLRPEEGGAILMFAPAGVIGYIGVNSMGLGLVTNQLYAPPQLGLTGYFIMRRLLACHTVAEALAWLENVEAGSASNYLLGDTTGQIADVELGSGKVAKIEGPFLCHTNHYLSEEMVELDKGTSKLPDSPYRLERVRALFGDRGGYDDAVAALRDHEGYPTSVCRHDSEMVTGASIVIALGQRAMLICKGNPCMGKYETYRVA
jgi:isopenicillin-N N-acyltransferase like protein